MSLFSDRVNELRKAKGLSKSKLLKDLELNPNSFVNWEKRGTIPSAEIVSRLALYLETTVEFLIGEPEKSEPLTPQSSRRETVLSKLSDYSTDELEKLLEYAEYRHWQQTHQDQ